MNNELFKKAERVELFIKKDKMIDWHNYVLKALVNQEYEELDRIITFIIMLGNKKFSYFSLVNMLREQEDALELLNIIQTYYTDSDNFILACQNPVEYQKVEEKTKIAKLTEQGKAFINPDKYDEWQLLVEDYVKNSFYQGIEIESLIDIMKALDFGFLAQAKNILDDSIMHCGNEFKDQLVYFYKDSNGHLKDLLAMIGNDQNTSSKIR